jgi:pseudouridine synthase
VASPGTLVEADRDQVRLRGELVSPPAGLRYLACNKPEGYLVTVRDPARRPTIFELLPEEERQRRLFPVGRLDFDSQGLLLLTDDGDLAHRLTHPRYGVAKEYEVMVSGRPAERDLRRLRNGVQLEDGMTASARVELLAVTRGESQLRIVLKEGRNRQVRRMLAALGYPVRRLTRTAIGPVRLGRLRPGGYRCLRPTELDALRQAVSS